MNLEIFEKAKILFEKGLSLSQEESYDLAEKQFLESLDLIPERLSTIYNLISIFVITNQKKKLQELLEKYKHLSNEKEILYGLAFNFHFNEKFSESIKICQELLQYKELKYSIQDLLASNYKHKKLFLDSLKIYQKKLREKKNYLIYYNIGCLFFDLGMIHKAYYYFNKSKELKDIDNSNLWNLSLCALTLEKFKYGFSLYEYRWNKKINPLIKKFPEIKSPNNLTEIIDKKILISDEQGLGDTLQFSRFVIDLLKYTKNITFVVNSKLSKILSNLNTNINVINYDNLELDNFDYQIPLCSLPKFLNIATTEDINYYKLHINIKKKNKI